jgi:transcriptional regulator with XRE-family HTH domain
LKCGFSKLPLFLKLKDSQVSKLKARFGKRLRQLRREKDLTQEQLAEAANISVESISNLERGIHAPSFDTLERLAKALGIPVKNLFDFD